MSGQRALSQMHRRGNWKVLVALFQWVVINAEESGQGTEDFQDHAGFHLLDPTPPGMRSSLQMRTTSRMAFAPNFPFATFWLSDFMTSSDFFWLSEFMTLWLFLTFWLYDFFWFYDWIYDFMTFSDFLTLWLFFDFMTLWLSDFWLEKRVRFLLHRAKYTTFFFVARTATQQLLLRHLEQESLIDQAFYFYFEDLSSLLISSCFAVQRILWMLSHNAIFRLFRSASGGGADSGVIGVNGSVNSSSARAILHELDAKNRTILDFGAGDGKFLICASVAGANHAIGIEFAENIGHKLLFDAVVHCILRRYSFRPSVQWIGLNIDQVRKIRMINRILSNCHNFWHGDWLSSNVFWSDGWNFSRTRLRVLFLDWFSAEYATTCTFVMC